MKLPTIIFPSREEADLAITLLNETFGAKGYVTAADVLEVAGMPATKLHERVGWKKENSFHVFGSDRLPNRFEVYSFDDPEPLVNK